MKKKVLSIVAVVLVLCCAIGGTLAWLTAKTGEVKNTFTPADIGVTLTETPNHDSKGDGKLDSWQAKMTPGFSYKKDPVVTVTEGSVDCYLFVKFEEKGDAAKYLTYTSTLTATNDWTQGTGETGNGVPTNVWFRKVMTIDTDRTWHLLAGDTITVNGATVTKDNMTDAAKSELVYTAYATQLWQNNTTQFDAKTAWDNASAQANP